MFVLIRSFFFWLLIIGVAFAKTLEPSDNIIIATGEFPPWTGEKLADDGCVNHIIREAFAHQKISVRFDYRPWKRAFEETKQGKYDATSYWYANADRRKFMLLSDPLIHNRTVFFQRSEDAPIHWQSFADLSGYHLGATIGFTYTEEFYQAIVTGVLNPIMVPNDFQNLKMLISKRIDIFATDEMSGFYLAKSLNLPAQRLRIIEPELSNVDGYLMAPQVSSNSKKLIENFNAGLKKLKSAGRYQQILDESCSNTRGTVKVK